MSSQNSWLLSVQEFFSFTNWQGQPRRISNEQQSLNLIAWQCLSLQEFFSFTNWQGQLHEKFSLHGINQSSSLTLQVSEFFKLICWEGHPEIGSLPKKLPLPNSFEVPIKTTLTDLSTLF
ncbi:hypothetical protein [Chroococcidiopsis sp. TS-821]|uniref:hypothetical protein n=1 Tax=Chroococcidiopsis sp. TS-821 TaxID=1378066 RepID=UPI000CEF4A21|nr:hypothetical protein [Chroococcidiopsis sp. TS-821]